MTPDEEFDRLLTHPLADSTPRVWPLDPIEVSHAQS